MATFAVNEHTPAHRRSAWATRGLASHTELPKLVGTIPTYIVYDNVTQCLGEPSRGQCDFGKNRTIGCTLLHCRLFPGFEAAVNPLERRASSTIDACEQRQHAQAHQQRRGRPLERGLLAGCIQRSRKAVAHIPSPAGEGAPQGRMRG